MCVQTHDECCLHAHYKFSPRPNLLLLAVYAGLVSSITALWFRPLVTALLNREWEAFETFVPYTSIGVVAVTGIWAAGVLEPRGLGTFLQSQWIPVHFVSCLLFFGIAGEIVYRDWVDITGPMLTMLLVALANIVWGVFLVQRHHPLPSTSVEEVEIVEETVSTVVSATDDITSRV